MREQRPLGERVQVLGRILVDVWYELVLEYHDVTGGDGVVLEWSDDNGTNSVASDTGWVAKLYVNGSWVEDLDIDATYGNPENTTTTITFVTATSGTDSYTIVITAQVNMHNVPSGTATETVMDSATGIDAGN